MKSCYLLFFFKVRFLIPFLCFFAFGAQGLWSQTAQLDSLRTIIQNLQKEVKAHDSKNMQLSQQLNVMNDKIYQYKTKQIRGANLITSFRLQNALKSAHDLADRIEESDRELRQLKKQLQNAYETMSGLINDEIKKRLSRVSQGPKDKQNSEAELELIKKLEDEEAAYAVHLQKIKQAKNDWENLTIEPDDTPHRINLKIALLEDFLQKLELSLKMQDKELKETKNQQSTYNEMLDYYRELEQSLEDNQDFFDRTRIDELTEKIDNLDMKVEQIKKAMQMTSTDILVLKSKIAYFKSAAGMKNE